MKPVKLTHKQTLNVEIAEHVKRWIREQNLRPHELVPSEGELAKKFSVSKMTTKLALNRLEEEGIVYRLARRGTFMAENTIIERLDLMPAESRFKPKPVVVNERKCIAIIVPRMGDYESRIIMATEKVARDCGWELILRTTGNREEEVACLKSLPESGAAGAIYFPNHPGACADFIRYLMLQHYPIVLIDRTVQEIQIDSVSHDYYQGTYDLVSHLIRKGHRHIGYITSSFGEILSRKERYQGYIGALNDHALPVHSDSVLFDYEEMGESKIKEPNQQLTSYIHNNSRMTAVVCANDLVAANLMYTSLSLRLRIPEQLSITGFSDGKLSSMLPIPLTTVKQPTDQLAFSAVRLLIKRIDHSREAVLTIKIHTSLVERHTVATIIPS